MLFWGLGRYVDLYGGQGATAALTDSWEWTSTGWQAVNSGEPPEGRVLASVAYDTTTDVGVMFGGATAFNGSATSSMSTLGRSGRWSPAQPIGPPSPRLAAPFAYDASDGYFVLFGGWTSTSPSGPVLNDTWTYTGTNWTNITNSSDRPLPAPVPTPVPATSLSGIELGYIGAAIVVAALAIGLVAYWVRARRRSRPPMTGGSGPSGPPGAP